MKTSSSTLLPKNCSSLPLCRSFLKLRPLHATPFQILTTPSILLISQFSFGPKSALLSYSLSVTAVFNLPVSPKLSETNCYGADLLLVNPGVDPRQIVSDIRISFQNRNITKLRKIAI